MERSIWLQEKRRLAEVRYDTLHAASYDQKSNSSPLKNGIAHIAKARSRGFPWLRVNTRMKAPITITRR